MTDSGFQFNRIALAKHKFAVTAYAGVEADVEVMKDIACECALIRVTAAITCQKLEEVCARYPADWWQAVRERWAPRWWLARWPVRYTKKRLEAIAKYPDMVILGQRAYVQTLRTKEN